MYERTGREINRFFRLRERPATVTYDDGADAVSAGGNLWGVEGVEGVDGARPQGADV